MSRSTPMHALSAPTSALLAEDLHNAFRKFAAQSTQLEGRYQALRAETELLRARLKQKDEEIAQQARLAMLGETAAALAHEVRNPLGALTLFLSLLRQETGATPSAGELIGHMERTISSLNHVVENILHFAKDNHTHFAPVNLHALIGEQRVLLSARPGAMLTIQESLQADPYIRGNEHALRQVIANVLTNAAEAMRWKGTLSVASQNRGETELVLTITDNGTGIPVDLLPRIGEPFVTGKGEGTGLGLAVTKKILAQHGARIEIRNRAAPERGAEVTIYFRREGTISDGDQR